MSLLVGYTLEMQPCWVVKRTVASHPRQDTPAAMLPSSCISTSPTHTKELKMK